MTRHLWPTLLLLATPLHAAPVEFNRDVRPILSEHCFACHGPDSGKRKAGLRLDVAESARSVLGAKKPDESDLYKRLTHDDAKKRMPPASERIRRRVSVVVVCCPRTSLFNMFVATGSCSVRVRTSRCSSVAFRIVIPNSNSSGRCAVT